MSNSGKSIMLIVIITFLLVSLVWFLKTKFSSADISNINKTIQVSPSPSPDTGLGIYDTSSYNPPKEFKYERSTNLKEILDSIDPQVLNSDFEQLKSLAKSI